MKKIGLAYNLLNAKRLFYDPASYFKELLDKHDGLIDMRTPRGTIILSDRPELTRHVLQKNYKNYEKTEVVKKRLASMLGHGLLTTDGEEWLKNRRAIQPGFHKQRLEAISVKMVEVIQEYMDVTLARFAQSGETMDLGKEMMALAFLVVSRSLLGEMVSQDELELIARASQKSQEMVARRLPFLDTIYKLTGAEKRVKQMKEELDGVLFRIISERKESDTQHDDLLDLLLTTRYEDGSAMSDQQVVDEAKVLYAAGHETSALTLTWTFYLIATHPDVESELIESIGSGIGDAVPEYQGLNDLAYTLQVLEESMRLYPPVWIIGRHSIGADQFEDVKIAADTDIVFLIYGMHRDPDSWQDPDLFIPERFNAENRVHHKDSAYIPFGIGPRMCIGKGFALMEMQFIVAMIMREYRFEIVGDKEVELEPLITLKPKNGIKVRVRKRN